MYVGTSTLFGLMLAHSRAMRLKTRLPSNSLASEGQNLTSQKERLREYFKSIKKDSLQKNKCMFSGMSSVHCPISFPWHNKGWNGHCELFL